MEEMGIDHTCDQIKSVGHGVSIDSNQEMMVSMLSSQSYSKQERLGKLLQIKNDELERLLEQYPDSKREYLMLEIERYGLQRRVKTLYDDMAFIRNRKENETDFAVLTEEGMISVVDQRCAANISTAVSFGSRPDLVAEAQQSSIYSSFRDISDAKYL